MVKQSRRISLRNSYTLNTSRRAIRIPQWNEWELLDHILSCVVIYDLTIPYWPVSIACWTKSIIVHGNILALHILSHIAWHPIFSQIKLWNWLWWMQSSYSTNQPHQEQSTNDVKHNALIITYAHHYAGNTINHTQTRRQKLLSNPSLYFYSSCRAWTPFINIPLSCTMDIPFQYHNSLYAISMYPRPAYPTANHAALWNQPANRDNRHWKYE